MRDQQRVNNGVNTLANWALLTCTDHIHTVATFTSSVVSCGLGLGAVREGNKREDAGGQGRTRHCLALLFGRDLF